MTQRRLWWLDVAIIVLFCLMLCRVYWVATDTAYAASAGGQTEFETALPRGRGNFYDADGKPLTGVTPVWHALCIPGDASYSEMFPYVPFAAQTTLYERRNSYRPFLIEVEQDLSAQGVTTYASSRRYLPSPIAPHLIGYLNGEGHGVSGLEYAYDDRLFEAAPRQTVACITTAQGGLLTGTAPTMQTKDKGTEQGVRLTLDADLQRACEAIAQQQLPRGCIVVLRTDGTVAASVSRPEFDPENVAQSIAANDTSLINRPLAAFSAGSVFKVVLAVAAYQAGLDWYSTTCEGSIQVADQTFRCALGRAHGEINLRAALEESCNCYFIELGEMLGAERIRQTAQAFGFGTSTVVAPGLKSQAGSLPTEQALESAGELAMFSFGQGSLTVTPLQIAAMVNAVANGGVYQTPCFVQGICREADAALVEPWQRPEPRRVCSPAISNILRDMLVTVVKDGIGQEAAPHEGSAGGKTGTAQTGQFTADGKELLNYWFAGFWPAEQPQYTVVVLQDAVRSPEYSSAEIFAQIANTLFVYENS